MLPNCRVFPANGFEDSVISIIPITGHSSDIGQLMAHTGVAVRTGKVCAHPLVDRISGSKGIKKYVLCNNTTSNI